QALAALRKDRLSRKKTGLESRQTADGQANAAPAVAEARLRDISELIEERERRAPPGNLFGEPQLLDHGVPNISIVRYRPAARIHDGKVRPRGSLMQIQSAEDRGVGHPAFLIPRQRI